MKYSSLRQCVSDLERTGRLVSIEESVDPNLEMAAIHLRVFRAGGPALLFKNVKNSPFPAVSNLSELKLFSGVRFLHAGK
jgi:4-hydroxy-3-polyprenylbenzoate decarboxylase